jgi:galactose mutarotase-like enzyme
LGAELVSIARRGADGRWTGFLWRDGDVSRPAEGWGNHSTVMGFYSHRIKGERSLYRGQEIRGGTHSFIRRKMFGAPAVDSAGGSLIYSLGPAQIEPHEYPLKVELTLIYGLGLAGDQPELTVTFEFSNHEPELSAHLSFGLHPGFAVQSLADARVILPKGTYTRYLAPGNFLSGETVTIEHPGGPLEIDKAKLPDSLLLAPAQPLEEPCAVEDRAGHRRIELDYHDAPYITIWSDGHDFICVEPCWGLPDHQEQRPFEQKEGIQEIPPGGKLSRTIAIRPQLG